MASYNITSNVYLRELYSQNRSLATSTERAKVTITNRGAADAKALKKGISSLSSYDYDAEIDDETKFYKTLKAFADTYNNTIESGTDLSNMDSRTKSIVKDIKKLQEKYEDELENYGLTFDKKGYMSINSLAMDNISPKNYKNVLGEDSEFLSDLGKLQKKLSRRINYLV